MWVEGVLYLLQLWGPVPNPSKHRGWEKRMNEWLRCCWQQPCFPHGMLNDSVAHVIQERGEREQSGVVVVEISGIISRRRLTEPSSRSRQSYHLEMPWRKSFFLWKWGGGVAWKYFLLISVLINILSVFCQANLAILCSKKLLLPNK